MTNIADDDNRGPGPFIPPPGICPAGWTYYGATHTCFRSWIDNVKATTARTLCQGLGAELASIADQNEEDFVESISYVDLILM